MSRLRRIIGALFAGTSAAGSSSTEAGVDGEQSAVNGSDASTDALMRDGVARHMKGDLNGAKAAYQAVLAEDCDHIDALHLLGSVLGQQGELDSARELLQRAIDLAPGHSAAMVDLGNVHRVDGDAKRALECYHRALVVDPDNTVAHRNVGYLRLEIGSDQEGLEHLKRALAAEPDVFQDQFTLAETLAKSGAHAEAIPHYRKVVALNPGLAVAHNHLAFSLSACGSHDAAVEHYCKAIKLDPKDYTARNDFGLLLQKFTRYEEAAEQFGKTVELNPEFPGGYLNLGNVHREARRFAEARRCYEKALELDPDNPDAHNNLGTVLKDQGRVAEATNHMQRALVLRPGFPEAHSNLLMNFHYMDDVDMDALYERHVDWVRRQIGEDVTPVSNHRNSRNPDRPLRIGYLSPDFCTHPVGLFLAPVLQTHDRSRVHVTCYDDLYRGDAVSERLKSLADEWRSVAGLGDERIAETIRNDGIDILIDLAGHTANNRIRLFAHKPAPVQATWIGYLHSTGLPQMDYLIADAVAVPADTQQRFSETILRLPQCFLCYGQPGNRPDVAPPPAFVNGYVTFGCYNNLAKVSDKTLGLWKRILEHKPNSRLLLKTSVFNDAECRDECMQRLEAIGFNPARTMLRGSSTHDDYFSSYGQIDIALDPLPFSGGTVSADALWMGVPVVTLAGDRMASRTSASILGCLGLDFLVTRDHDSYVNAALSLGEDAAVLAELRRGMRRRFRDTAFGEPAAFTANLEKAYRNIWRRWCRQSHGPG